MREQSYTVKMLLSLVLKSLRAGYQATRDELDAWLPESPVQRKRWITGIAAVPVLGVMVAAFATAPSAPGLGDEGPKISEPLNLSIQASDVMRAEPLVTEERVRKSDTIGTVFSRLGINDGSLNQFIKSDRSARPMLQLKPGKVISAQLDSEGQVKWVRYWFDTEGQSGYHANTLLIERKPNGRYVARNDKVAFERQFEVKAFEVKGSLYSSTDNAGIPDAIAHQLPEVFSSDLDFYSEVSRGDRFRIIYEMLRANGEVVRPGRILAAEFMNGKASSHAFWFVNAQGNGGYYTDQGKSVKKAFLRSPIEYSRVTSGFTNARLHPILQEWRAHKGVDYGAPMGTRVRATSDGVVDMAGWQNGYGNVVVVKHGGPYSTVYAHLSGFGPGIRKGARISQGELLGYVGATGWATGPHLHYEFKVNNVQQNPLTIALPTAQPLEGSALALFKKQVGDWKDRLALADNVRVARSQ